jgi:peptide deformylase
MSQLNIKTYHDSVIREKCTPVKSIDKEIQSLIDNMIETMYAAPGIGLAATQVGASSRVIVIDTSFGEDPDALLVLINPEIVHSEGEIVEEEGCLSVPGITAKVKRAEKVKVKGLNREGKEVMIEADGLLARVLQHEIDHINGLVFVDRLSRAKKVLLKNKLKKIESENE